ncbi:MAG: large conductance mechanosensitive channel protein MscL [Acidimicrobiales bacterium]
MISGFKKFILQGNVVDLAVGIIIGGVFGAVVKSFTEDIIMQIVAAIVGKPDFGSLSFDLGDATIRYGNFLNAVITFVITAAAVYFAVVVPINHIKDRRSKGVADEVEPTNEERMVALLEQIAAK